MNECGHRPAPGAWDHWACQRGRFHIGRHRFNNYTWRHGAKTWGLLRYGVAKLRLKLKRAEPWRVAVRRTATKYQPVPVAGGETP